MKKFIYQRGLSLSEALVALFVSTIIMGATYVIYNNFQGTFIRQINHNNMKQEARFALHILQHDSKMAGYKHPDNNTDGEVQEPVKVLNTDGTEVTDDTEYGEKVSFCFDTEDNSGNIQRKLIQYELKIPYSPETEKTVLKKKIWNTSNCDETDTVNTTVDVDWMPVAQFFKPLGFKVRLRSKHIDFEVTLQSIDEKVTENYTASAYMRNLNYGGSSYYVFNEEDLHENRTAVIPFTGSLKVQCSNNLTRDIQLSNFVTNDDLIILHQGEKVGTSDLNRTHDEIRFNTEKPPAVTGIPDISHDEMRLKLVTVSADTTIPPGLTATSLYDDENSNSSADDGEWNGGLSITGTLNKIDGAQATPAAAAYNFNADGFQDFNIRLKAELQTNCDGEGWVAQNAAYKDYTIRVMKFSAPQFSDVNLHTWEPKGFTYGDQNYESNGPQDQWGGPNYDLTEDGRAFYIRQNLASPSFLVSTEEYDSFVLKGMTCSGGYPDCNHNVSPLDDDMLGFAAGYQRPTSIQKKWPDGKIRACAGIDYQRLNGTDGFSSDNVRDSLSNADITIWNALSDDEKDQWWGEPADLTYDMYLWSWWGARGNQSAIHLHHFKGYEFEHTRNCGKTEGSYLSHANMSHLTGWSTPSDSQFMNYNTLGYDRLFARFDDVRPTNGETERCSGKEDSYSRISFNPGAYHAGSNCWGSGRDAGVKNTVTMTFHPNKFRANIENKPHQADTLSQQFTAFDYRFDTSGNLKDHTNTTFPYTENASGTAVALPGRSQDSAELKATGFKRFQKGSVAIASFSQPDNRYSNIQIAKLPRYVPTKTAVNKPMPKAQNLYYYMDSEFKTINRIYGLLSKSYDPQGEHLEVLVEADTSACSEIGSITGDLAETGSYKTQTLDGASRNMNCRLSGTWQATTAVWANNTELPNIGELYDTENKSAYSGARATVSTTAGGKMYIFADGSFRYKTLPSDFNTTDADEDSFYYAVQTKDSSNNRVSDIKKVYIGFNIANTTPTDVSFKEEDGTDITSEANFDMPEDADKELIIGEIYVDDTDEPDDYDFVRFNLGQIPDDDAQKDVDHGTRFRIDQKDGKFYLVLNDDADIRWANLPSNKKFFAVRIIATDLRGNKLSTTKKVYVDRVDCSETAMENISVYKTKAAMTIEGFIQGREGEKVFRRQTVPFTDALDEAVITFDFPERSVQPSVKISEQTVTVGGEDVTIGMLSNRCKDSHSYIARQQLWSDS